MYSFIPFAVLLVTNILLIVDLHKKAKTIQGSDSVLKKNQFSINLSVVVLTLIFIVLTCPSAIACQYYTTLIMTPHGIVLVLIADCCAFTYHAFNIVILSTTNKLFRRKLIELFCKRKTSATSKESHVKTTGTTSTEIKTVASTQKHH